MLYASQPGNDDESQRISFDIVMLQLIEHCDMLNNDLILVEEFKQYLEYVTNLKFSREP